MPAPVQHRILFNFSASPVGGGLKRLSEYAKWFDAHGGAWFMVPDRCEGLRDEFPQNQFFVVKRSPLRRILNDFASVREAMGRMEAAPDCYYSYGIPLYQHVGLVTWFHLSNVLPLAWRRLRLPFGTRVRVAAVGRRIVAGLPHADVVSAESRASLALLAGVPQDRLFLSVNGSDDELADAGNEGRPSTQPLATVVGTYAYKALDESARVFDALRTSDPDLKLVIFGDETLVPPSLARRRDVVLRGSQPRETVIDTLRRSRYYISTTQIENSYNAASEGIFLAGESFVSDIGPHRELLSALPHLRVTLPGTTQPLLSVKRADVSVTGLQRWDDVITAMNEHIQHMIRAKAAQRTHAGL